MAAAGDAPFDRGNLVGETGRLASRRGSSL
jgi:hypothetical protein